MGLTRDDAMKKFRDREVPGQASGNGAGNPVWRDGGMSTSHLFDRLAAELDRLGRGVAGPAALERLARAGVDLGGATSPLELALACRSPRRRWASANLTVLGCLVPGDDVATLVVLVALRHPLVGMAQRLANAGVPNDEADGVVVAAALSTLAELEPVAGRDVARAVVTGVWAGTSAKGWPRTRSRARWRGRSASSPSVTAASVASRLNTSQSVTTSVRP